MSNPIQSSNPIQYPSISMPITDDCTDDAPDVSAPECSDMTSLPNIFHKSSGLTFTDLIDLDQIPKRKSIPLSHAFSRKRSLYLSKIETFTDRKFKELILDHQAQGVPFYLAMTKDENGHVAPFDAVSIFFNIHKYGQVMSPLTNKKITEIWVYGINKISDAAFQILFPLEATRKDADHYAKIICASSDHVKSEERGKYRYYVASILEQKGETQQAAYWYQMALKDGYFKAYLAISVLLLNESTKTKSYKSLATNILTKATPYISPEDAKIIKQVIEKISNLESIERKHM